MNKYGVKFLLVAVIIGVIALIIISWTSY